MIERRKGRRCGREGSEQSQNLQVSKGSDLSPPYHVLMGGQIYVSQG